MKFIGATLVNTLIEVSGVGFYVTRSVYCTVCPPPKVKSPSFTVYEATQRLSLQMVQQSHRAVSWPSRVPVEVFLREFLRRHWSPPHSPVSLPRPGGNTWPCDLTPLSDRTRVVGFSVFSAFYLLLGWVRTSRLLRASWETDPRPRGC